MGVSDSYNFVWNVFFIQRNRNRNKLINQIRAPGGQIQITNMIDTHVPFVFPLKEKVVKNISFISKN
jgi:hypothetical protein